MRLATFIVSVTLVALLFVFCHDLLELALRRCHLLLSGAVAEFTVLLLKHLTCIFLFVGFLEHVLHVEGGHFFLRV